MESFVDGFIGILLIVSLIVFILSQLCGSTKLIWKRVLLGGIAAAIFAVIAFIHSGVPIDETFVGGVLCIGGIGGILILGRWVSNKSVDRLLKRYGRKK